MENNTSTFPFFPILTLIFITLKLTGFINWSWLWVLSPLLIPVVFWMMALVIITLVTVIAEMMRGR